MSKGISRRSFLRMAGGAAAGIVGARYLPKLRNNVLRPVDVVEAAPDYDLFIAGTDGWASLPSMPAIPPFFPDDLAPSPFNLYIFGFRNVSGLSPENRLAQKMKATQPAPLFWTQEDVPFRLKVTNLGLHLRPDLIDEHTVHWHGFRDVIPYYDGEPSTSIAIPILGEFTYVYNAHHPGTYMYHCHVEDVEHVQMGMTGLVFVRPTQDGNTALYPSGKYAYNDGDGSTGFDREFALVLTEVWAEAHWTGSHVQAPEWSDYRVDYGLINGRAYPDTVAPNGSIDPFNPVTDPLTGDLEIPDPPYAHLQYQPLSSLVTCNAGERVLLRLSNMGFMQAAMTLSGLKVKVVGKDAGLLRGRDDTDQSYMTDVMSTGAGESFDAILEAPAYQGPGPYDKYLFYNRNYLRSSNLSAGGYGGQMTEVRVYPTGTLPPQTLPNYQMLPV